MDVQEEITKFLKLCKKVTDNDAEVLQLIKKRLNKADKIFLSSDDFHKEVTETSEKINEDHHNKYVHLKKFLALLKSQDSKKKKKRSSDTDSSLPDAKRQKKNESEEEEEEKDSPETSKSIEDNSSPLKEEIVKSEEKTETLSGAESSSDKVLLIKSSSVESLSVSSKTGSVSPVHFRDSVTDKEDLGKERHDEEECNITIKSLPLNNYKSIPLSLSPKVSLRRISLITGECINGTKPSKLLKDSDLLSIKPVKAACTEAKETEEENSPEPHYVSIALDDEPLPDIPPTPIVVSESQSDVEFDVEPTGDEEEENNKEKESESGDEVQFVGLEVIQDLDEGETEEGQNGDGEAGTESTGDARFGEATGASARPAEEDDDDQPPPLKGSKKQLQKLVTLLERISAEIQKLEERELSLDDLGDDNSAYAMEDKYKKKFVKVWNKYCEVAGRPPSTGRPTERKFRFEGTRYPEINKKIERFINMKKIFPDYHDIRDIIGKCNKKYKIHLRPTHVDSLARDAFTLVGNELQKRRLLDFSTDFESRLPAPVRQYSDPALFDRDLRQKLDCNKKTYKDKMAEVINKYAHKQEVQGDDTDEDSESDEDDDGKKESEVGDRDGESDTAESTSNPTPPASDDENHDQADYLSDPTLSKELEKSAKPLSGQAHFMASLSLGHSSKDEECTTSAEPMDCEDQNSPESITYEVLVDSAQLRKEHENAGDDIAEVLDLTDNTEQEEVETINNIEMEKAIVTKSPCSKVTPEKVTREKNIDKSPYRKIVPERILENDPDQIYTSIGTAKELLNKTSTLAQQDDPDADSDSQSLLLQLPNDSPEPQGYQRGDSPVKLKVLPLDDDDDSEMEVESDPMDQDSTETQVKSPSVPKSEDSEVKQSATDGKEVSLDLVGYVSLVNFDHDKQTTEDSQTKSSVTVMSSEEQEPESETIDLTSSQSDQIDCEEETTVIPSEKPSVHSPVSSSPSSLQKQRTPKSHKERPSSQEKKRSPQETKKCSPQSDTAKSPGNALGKDQSPIKKTVLTQNKEEIKKDTLVQMRKKFLSPRSKRVNLEKIVTSVKATSESVSSAAKSVEAEKTTISKPSSQKVEGATQSIGDISYIEIDDDSLSGSPIVKPSVSSPKKDVPESIDLTSPKEGKEQVAFSPATSVDILQKVIAQSGSAAPLLKASMDDIIKKMSSKIAASTFDDGANVKNGQNSNLQNQNMPGPIAPHNKITRRKLDMNAAGRNSTRPAPVSVAVNKSFASSFKPLDSSTVGRKPVTNSPRPFVGSSVGNRSVPSSAVGNNAVLNPKRLVSSTVTNSRIPNSSGSSVMADARRGKLSLSRSSANPSSKSSQPRSALPGGGRPSEVHFQRDIQRKAATQPVCSTPMVGSREGGLKISSISSLATGQMIPVRSPPEIRSRPNFPGQRTSNQTNSRTLGTIKPISQKPMPQRPFSTNPMNSRPGVSRPGVPGASRPAFPRPWSPRSMSAARPTNSRFQTRKLSLSSSRPRPVPSRPNRPVVNCNSPQNKEIVILSDSD